MIIADIVKIFIPAALSFAVGILLAPLLTHYLYKYKAWKKTPQKIAFDGSEAVEFGKLRSNMHPDTETKTTRMGGILIWATTAIITIGLCFFDRFTPLG